MKKLQVLRKIERPIAKIGKTGTGKCEFRMPMCIAINNDGRLFYVTDTLNHRVQCFTGNGEYLTEFRISGPTDNHYPAGIAINDQGREIVCPRVMMTEAESLGDTIQIYDLEGKLKHEIKNMRLGELTNVIVNSQEHIIVSDWFEHALFMFEKNGRLIKRIGDRGFNTSHFRRPSFIALGFDDDILVADSDKCRIQILDKQGTIKSNFGHYASGEKVFTLPSGIAVDSHGNILVCDEVENTVTIFSYFGEYKGTITSTRDPLNFPQGIAVTPDGYAIVVDTKNDCLKIYRYMDFV